MNKKIFSYCVTGFIFVSILGSLSHFFYEWSGENSLVALVCPVNESTWEHMKLLFFPVILYTFFFSFRCREYPAVPAAMLFANMVGLVCIPVLFYTYSGVYGNHVSFIDIGIFFVSVAVVFYLAYHWIVKEKQRENQKGLCLKNGKAERYQGILMFVSIMLAICFIIFTYYPPAWGIFQG